jgi:hypothetical protein
MERSVVKVVNDFFIGKYIEFYIEARHIGDEISRIHETNGKTKKLTIRKTEYGEYKYVDEKIIDKIIKIEQKWYDWYFLTLEGYLLKRRSFQDLKVIDANS